MENVAFEKTPQLSRYLITGGAGFIGSYLAAALAKAGHAIRVLDNFSTGSLSKINAHGRNLELVEGDAAKPECVREALRDVDGIFHLAAIPSVSASIRAPLRTQASGEVAALNVFDEARKAGIRRVVFASSAAVYGDCKELPIFETATMNPLSTYGVGKAATEMYARSLASTFANFDPVCLRFFNVFGPGQSEESTYAGVITLFLKCLRERRPATIFGDGEQTRDFIHVRDAVSACILAMESTRSFRGGALNIATGKGVSLDELWAILQRVAGISVDPVYEAQRTGDIRHSVAAVDESARELLFRASIPLETGLKEMYEAAAAPR